MKKLFTLILFFIPAIFFYGQNQANIWYFGSFSGLDFNSGKPKVVYGHTYNLTNVAVQCDTNGNILFYSDGTDIINRNHRVMLNGDSVASYDGLASQRVWIIQKPESDNLYYVFFVSVGQQGNGTYDYGLTYNIVDMNGDNGLGEVIEKDVLIPAAYHAQNKLFAIKHANKRDVWIITYLSDVNKYASFLLTPDGINLNPVISDASYAGNSNHDGRGILKISYNKKYFVSTISLPNQVEIGYFNDTTGALTLLYYINQPNPNSHPYHPLGIEFSPDSKYLYVAYHAIFDSGPSELGVSIYQYDMQYVNDHVQFTNSAIPLVINGSGIGLQLARDGKIYCSSKYCSGFNYYKYVSVIHKPWERGAAADYERDVFFEESGLCEGLVNILPDYLYRFEWEGECSGPSNAIRFKPNFMFPDSIHWNFGDPASGADSISYEISPVHYFSSGGEFEVSADVWYPPDSANPWGRYEHTSRVVTVKQSPQPDLGSDTLICNGGSIELNGGAGQGSYLWSTGDFGMNDSLVTVSDTGTYWVKVSAPNGCSTTDTVHVGWHPPAQFVEDSLVITPTACGGSSGSITGLMVDGVPPLIYEWQDAEGNPLGNSLNLFNLGVGNYFLLVTDGNGCTTVSDSYTVTDAGNITVDTVAVEAPHCGQNNGSITISAHSGATSYLNYSVDDGNSWQQNNPVFQNIAPGNYFIRVSDTNGCQSVYNHNPVSVEDISAPELISISTVDETNFDQNGEIHLTATGNGTLYYSIDNGGSFQTDDGNFTGLPAGTYHCIIQDDYGCDTAFDVTINRLSTQLLEAIAGDGHSCLGDAAVVPLVVSGFDSVKRFRAELFYDSSVLTVKGYQNVNSAIKYNLSVQWVQNSNRVIALWENATPVTLNNNATLLQLVFEGKKEGYSAVDWAHSAGESSFINHLGEPINTQYQTGNVMIFSTPEILLANEKKVCEGDLLMLSPAVSGGSGAYEFLWQGPDGFSSHNNLLWINSVTQSMGGQYTFTVSNTAGCVESKTVTVTVDPGPVVSFAGIDTLFVNPGDILDAGSDAVSYRWNTGDTTAAIKIDSMGIYRLETVSANGCKSYDTVQILWGGTPFFVPNAFTPNGDGLNDVFKVIPRYDYIRDLELLIYNRWGQLIYEGHGSDASWNGTCKGQPVEQGIYVYVIGYRDFQTNRNNTVRGTVMVMR